MWQPGITIEGTTRVRLTIELSHEDAMQIATTTIKVAESASARALMTHVQRTLKDLLNLPHARSAVTQ